MLEVRYQRPEWHLEHEVTLGIRRIDSVAFRMWGGSGRRYQLLGFEIKVSRADWRRELEQFHKAKDWSEAVDEFFIVAPPGVVPAEELPKGWGLLEVRGSKLFLKAHAARTETRRDMPREVAARLMDRQARELAKARADVSQELRPTIASAVRAEFEERHARELAALQEKSANWDQLTAGLAALGMDSWRARQPEKTLAAAARVLGALEQLPSDWQIERIPRDAQSLADQLARATREWREASVEFATHLKELKEAAR